MTVAKALGELQRLARARAFGQQVGSDRLIQAGLDALLAEVDSPSLALLAGLGRREEPEAPELFDQVLDELGLAFHAPVDPTAARWALAYWLAEQIVDGSLDAAAGVDLIWVEVAMELDYPEELRPVVECAIQLGDWDDHWSVNRQELQDEALRTARDLLRRRPSSPQLD